MDGIFTSDNITTFNTSLPLWLSFFDHIESFLSLYNFVFLASFVWMWWRTKKETRLIVTNQA